MSRSSNANDVLDRLHALMHGLRHHMHAAAQQEGDGLGHMEARCLRFFAQHAGATQSDLVQHSGRDKAQIARIVKSLIERDLLQSEPNPADGRSQILSVSAQGQSLQRKMQAHQASFEKRLMTGFSAGERAVLIALLDRLQANAGVG